MPRPQRDPAMNEGAQVDTLLAAINAAHGVFQNRHNWLSPLTTDDERKQFIARYCDWWNNVVCPAMDAVGARWNEQDQRFVAALKETYRRRGPGRSGRIGRR